MISLDAYIESILSRMVVDDAQRVEIGKELRSHLEDAINDGISKGLTREEAEKEAMLQFGQPSFLARQFGIVNGRFWYYFEHIACVLFVSTCFLFLMSFQNDFSPLRGLGLMALIWFVWITAIFKSVEVNGGLFFKRLFRKSRHIPFGTIIRVRFQKSQILRRKNIVIETSKEKFLMTPEWEGFKAASIALLAIVSDKTDEKVTKYLEKIKVKTRDEPLNVRFILAFLWISTLAWFLLVIQSLWEGFGFGWQEPVIWFISLLIPFFQVRFHRDYDRRGICWLVAIVLFLSISMFVTTFFGYLFPVRYFSVWFVAAHLAGLILLWWRWSRTVLMGIIVGLGVIVLLSGFIMPGSFYSPELKPFFTTHTFALPFDVEILNEAGRLVWIASSENENKDIENFLISNGINQDLQIIQLPTGSWSLNIKQPSDKTFLIRYIEDDTEKKYELYLYKGDKQTVERTFTFPEECSVLLYIKIPYFSPDGKYFITRFKERSNDRDWKTAVFNLENGEKFLHEDFPNHETLYWEDDLHVIGEVNKKENKKDDKGLTGESDHIEFRRVNVMTGKQEILFRRDTGKNEKIYRVLPGSQYAIVRYDKSPIPKEMEWDEIIPDRCGILNLETGDKIDIPIFSETPWEAVRNGWSNESKVLVYPAVPEKDGEGQRLVSLDLSSGKIRIKTFFPNEDISLVKLSPDGEKIVFSRKTTALYRIGYCPRWDLWNIATDEIYPVNYLGLFGGEIMDIIKVLSWSSDSSWFAYPDLSKNFKGQHLLIKSVRIP